MSKNYLARKLIFRIILFSSFVTLILTGLQLYSEYNEYVGNLNHTIKHVKTGYLNGIETNVWLDDKEELTIILDGINSLPEISHISIWFKNKVYISSGESRNENVIAEKIPLTYNYNNKIYNIGDMRIEADLSTVYQRLTHRFIVILTSNAVKTFLVAIFIFAVVDKIIIRKLARISQFINSHDTNSFDKTIVISNQEKVADELDDVAAALNEMQHRLAHNFNKLHKSESQVRLLLDASGEAIFGIDNEGNCTFANSRCIELLGYTSIDQLLGNNMHQLMHYSHINGTEYPETECPIYQANKKGVSAHIDSEVFWQKNGCSFPVEYRAHQIIENDSITGSVITFNDISRRKMMAQALFESEKHYRLIVETAQEGICLIDKNGFTTFTNNKMAHILGSTADEVCGKPFCEFMEENSTSIIENQIAQHKQGVSGQFEVQLIKKDHSKIHTWISSNPLFDENGKYQGFLAMVSDITDKKSSEQEREMLQSQLQQAQKMEAIGQLTGGIAHDFNNILASMLGFTELIMDFYDGDDERIPDYLNEISTAGQRAQTLIQKMMTFSHGKREKPERQAIKPLIEEVVTLIRQSIPSSINIELDLPDNIPPLLLDKVMIHQALMNICLNARDAITNHGKISISTKLTEINNNQYCSSCFEKISGKYLALNIADSGSGIRQEDISKIFQPFYSSKEFGNGSGMGLPMVHGIVHDHGGHIVVESGNTSGSIFSLLFPIEEINNDIALATGFPTT